MSSNIKYIFRLLRTSIVYLGTSCFGKRFKSKQEPQRCKEQVQTSSVKVSNEASLPEPKQEPQRIEAQIQTSLLSVSQDVCTTIERKDFE